jgi:DNA-binding transcriptional ArsR family regulator
MTSTRISSHIKAPRAAVYRALFEPQAVAAWRVPDGMTSTAVDRLYERGLVTRTGQRTDRRVRLVDLTLKRALSYRADVQRAYKQRSCLISASDFLLERLGTTRAKLTHSPKRN